MPAGRWELPADGWPTQVSHQTGNPLHGLCHSGCSCRRGPSSAGSRGLSLGDRCGRLSRAHPRRLLTLVNAMLCGWFRNLVRTGNERRAPPEPPPARPDRPLRRIAPTERPPTFAAGTLGPTACSNIEENPAEASRQTPPSRCTPVTNVPWPADPRGSVSVPALTRHRRRTAPCRRGVERRLPVKAAFRYAVSGNPCSVRTKLYRKGLWWLGRVRSRPGAA